MRWDTRAFAGHSLASVSGTASSLPAGAVLGEERWENNIKYRLFYNDGGEVIYPGYCFKAKGAGQGPYSVTVSTVSESVSQVKGVNLHATSTTGTYFWGVVFGHPVKIAATNISIGTGTYAYPAANGQFVTTTTTSTSLGYLAFNQGVAASSATALTNANYSGIVTGNRFFVFFEEKPSWTTWGTNG